jgi:hypothetical protein
VSSLILCSFLDCEFLSNSVFLLLDLLGFNSFCSFLFSIGLVLHECPFLLLSLLGGENFGILGLGLYYLLLNSEFGGLFWSELWISGVGICLDLLFHIKIFQLGNQVFGLSSGVMLMMG